MVSEISGVDGAKTWNFQLLNRCSDQRMLEVRPPQKWGFWCQIRFWGPKNIKKGPKKWKKLIISKTAHLIFYLKSIMSSVNLMGTFCTGSCLVHWLLIFWFTRRGVNNNQDLKSFDLYGLFEKILWWWWVVFCFVLVVLPIAHPHQQVAHTSTININHTAKLFQKSDVTQNLSTIF